MEECNMARPGPEILHSAEVDGINWEITAAESAYVITYQGKPIGLRTQVPGLGMVKYKYYKMTYTHEGSARAAVRRLNKKFCTDEFSYVIMTV